MTTDSLDMHRPAYEELTVEELAARLREAEETLEAIRNGDVDAVVVGGPAGQQVYTLENADKPYRVLVEQMQEGAVTLAADGTILYCNRRFATLVGAPHEGIIGRAVTSFLAPAEGAALLHMFDAALGRGASSEFTLIDSGGADVPVNVSLIDLKVDEGMPRLVCGIITDLTFNRRRTLELGAANQRLATEIQERRRTEESLLLTLEAAGMGTWELDVASNELRWPLRHDHIFGYSEPPSSFALRAAIDQFLPEDRHTVASAFVRARTTGGLEFEARIRRVHDGAVRWVNVRGRSYFENGAPVRIAGVIADVTERREIEEQLRQAQKMEAVGQLTGGIAHDFNNLLMIVGGSLDMLGRRMPESDKVQALFGAARQAVAKGALLNQQLLAFSRRQDLHVQAVNLDELIPAFAHLLDRAVGETVTVEFRRGLKLGNCRTDPHQLETAILNLAINARDAMPQGGKLIINTANTTVDESLAARCGGRPGNYVLISVVDNGVGIAPDVLAHVFEPFFTTKDVGKGTGLGLSQVYGFARQSGGFVTIESEPGRGTIIAIYLPRTAETLQATLEITPRDLETGTGIILVVEDDPAVRATTSGMLEDLGYAVVTAESGPNALKLIAGQTPLDLVFSDVVMPDGMSGIELASQIGSLRPELPILLTSGYTAQRIVPETFAGELQLLRKPFSQRDLSVAIRSLIGASQR